VQLLYGSEARAGSERLRFEQQACLRSPPAAIALHTEGEAQAVGVGKLECATTRSAVPWPYQVATSSGVAMEARSERRNNRLRMSAVTPMRRRLCRAVLRHNTYTQATNL
jgi:hypothetical protein